MGEGEVWPDPRNPKPHWRDIKVPIREPFAYSERLGYVLRVSYFSSKGDPKWNGRFRADAVLDDGTIKPVLTETSDYDFGHHDGGKIKERLHQIFHFNQ